MTFAYRAAGRRKQKYMTLNIRAPGSKYLFVLNFCDTLTHLGDGTGERGANLVFQNVWVWHFCTPAVLSLWFVSSTCKWKMLINVHISCSRYW